MAAGLAMGALETEDPARPSHDGQTYHQVVHEGSEAGVEWRLAAHEDQETIIQTNRCCGFEIPTVACEAWQPSRSKLMTKELMEVVSMEQGALAQAAAGGR